MLKNCFLSPSNILRCSPFLFWYRSSHIESSIIFSLLVSLCKSIHHCVCTRKLIYIYLHALSITLSVYQIVSLPLCMFAIETLSITLSVYQIVSLHLCMSALNTLSLSIYQIVNPNLCLHLYFISVYLSYIKFISLSTLDTLSIYQIVNLYICPH